jgi:small-conductance mechanosensitive channel
LDASTELKIKDREIENADKQMNNLLWEYNRVKKRIEQVGDFNYAVKLKEKLLENEDKIRENEKQIKSLEQMQKRRDIQMNRLIKDDKTEKMRKVDYVHSKLTYSQEKINELHKKIETLEKVKEDQNKQDEDIRK